MRSSGAPLLVGALLLLVAGCGRGGAHSSGAGDASSAWVRVVTPEGHLFPGEGSALSRQTMCLVAVNAEEGRSREIRAWNTTQAKGFRLPTLYTGERLLLLAAGFRDLEIPEPLPDEPLPLAYGYPVRLRLETEGGLPTAPHEIEISVQWRGPGDLPEAPTRSGLRPAAREAWFRPEASGAEDPELWLPAGESEIAFFVSSPARYRVWWTLHRVRRWEGGMTAQGFSDASTGTSIEVLDVEGEQVFRIALDRRALDEALTVLER